MSFDTLNLHPLVLKAVSECGYKSPTPVQAQAIPEILKGADLMVSAQTGTGKTAAFMLPALQLLNEPPAVRGHGPRVLVLTPTRELANQVADATSRYGRYLKKVYCSSILGGMPYPPQIRSLSKPLDILVATPGRLIDHIERKRVDFSRVQMLVLDEADRMLDMGFVEDVENIAARITQRHQTLLFSATLGARIGSLGAKLLVNPRRITISVSKENQDKITQRLHFCDDMAHKQKLLEHWLKKPEVVQTLVFTATKKDADRVADALYEGGHDAAALHGDMSQRERSRTMLGMTRGRIRVLVATDVAARGIDVPSISHVINYDLPRSPEDYVHRIGRTGRAGACGTAISLASYREKGIIRRIEGYTARPLQAETIPGLEPVKRQRVRQDGKFARAKRRFSGAPGRECGFTRRKSRGRAEQMEVF